MTHRTEAADSVPPPFASIRVLLLGLGVLMLGNGLLGTLLGIRAETEGFATTVTGFVMAAYFAGFLAGAWLTPRSLDSVGHIRVFAGLASLASTAALVHALETNPLLWGGLRLLTGFCMAGLYVVAESWLNDQATNENRGRLMSAYMVVVMGGVAAGQLLLLVADADGFTLFVVASALLSMAVVPMALSATKAPDITARVIMKLSEVWHAAPLGVVGGFATGMANGALLGMGPVYGTIVGMSPQRVAAFMGLAFVGAVAFQIPIGLMSDHIPRRRAIFLVTFAAGAVAAAATLLGEGGTAEVGAMFVFGGLTFPLYSLHLSHINDMVPVGGAVAASSVFLFVTGIGSILGPPVAAVLMTTIGAAGFWWALAGMHTAIGLFALIRIVIKPGLPAAEQEGYTLVPARATAVIVGLVLPRRRNGK